MSMHRIASGFGAAPDTRSAVRSERTLPSGGYLDEGPATVPIQAAPPAQETAPHRPKQASGSANRISGWEFIRKYPVSPISSSRQRRAVKRAIGDPDISNRAVRKIIRQERKQEAVKGLFGSTVGGSTFHRRHVAAVYLGLAGAAWLGASVAESKPLGPPAAFNGIRADVAEVAAEGIARVIAPSNTLIDVSSYVEAPGYVAPPQAEAQAPASENQPAPGEASENAFEQAVQN